MTFSKSVAEIPYPFGFLLSKSSKVIRCPCGKSLLMANDFSKMAFNSPKL
jgi:hypothetical protein